MDEPNASAGPDPGNAAPWWRRLPASLRGIGTTAQGGVALLVCAVASFLLFCLPILSRFSSAYVGSGKADQQLYLWSMTWWPHAIGRATNPMLTDAVWAPDGVSLAWVTGVPGPSLLMAPLTLAAGPVASLNLLMASAPALAGWATFLLARRMTGAFWPSLAGALLFGFSTYEMGQMRGHLNLVQTAMVPLAAYLVVRRIQGRLGTAGFVTSLTAVLVIQFSISTEVFATVTMFGAIALGGAALLATEPVRGEIRGVLPWVGLAFVIAVGLLIPYLVYVFRDLPSEPLRNSVQGSVDLASFVIPRVHTLVGGEAFQRITHRFVIGPVGDGGYLGPPLLAILVLFSVERWRRRGWLLLAFAGLIALLAMGPVLHVLGEPSISLPWALATRVPLIQNAVPGRFVLYLWLMVAVVAATWLAARPRSWLRWAAAAIGAVAIFPRLDLPHPDVRVPAFFGEALYREHLEPGETILPVAPKGTEMAWQVAGGMDFRLATGHVGFIPPRYRGPAVQAVRRDRPELLQPGMLQELVDRHDVGAIVVDPVYAPGWEEQLRRLWASPLRVGGVILYDLEDPGVPDS